MRTFVLSALLLLNFTLCKAQLGADFDVKFGIGYTKNERVSGNIAIDLGVKFNNDVVAGLFYDHFNTTSENDYLLNEKYLFRCNTAGIYLKKVFFKYSPIRFSIPMKVGIGGANYSNHHVTGEYYDEYYEFCLHEKEDKCFVTMLEPGFNLEIPIMEKMAFISVDASYKMIKKLDLEYYYDNRTIASGNDLDSWYFGVSFGFLID